MHPPGPLLVVAGAGSGKTRVITYRLARLVAAGADPRRIMAVTFTNKAAGELRERVDKLLWDRMGIGTRGLWVGTFHATCARILRQWGETVGLRKDFVIYDDDDQKRLLGARAHRPEGPRAHVPRAPGAVGDRSRQEPGHRPHRLRRQRLPGRRRRQGVSPVRGAAGGGERDRLRRPAAVGAAAGRRRHARRRGARRALRPRAGRRVPGHQQRPVPAGAAAVAPHAATSPSSATRTSRSTAGAAPTSATSSTSSATTRARAWSSWSGTTARPATSWRAANAIIERNSERRPKRLFTEEGEGERIVLFEGETERDEAEFVAGRIEDALSATLAPRDFAVFYRTNAQSRVLEEALRARNLPYAVVGGTRFFDRAEIKDLVCYMRAVANPDDGMALQRIINVPARGIGGTTVDRIGEIIYERKLRPWEVLELVARDDQDLLGTGPRKKVAAFVQLMTRLRAEGAGWARRRWPRRSWRRPATATRWPAEATMEAEGRIENLLEFVGQMREYETRGRGADAARVPRAHRAGLRRRRLRSRKGRDLADDRAHGQGARVPGRVHHRPRGADLPARAQRRRRLGGRGGAAPVLRRGHARAQAAVPVARAAAAAVGPGAARRAQPLPARRAGRVPGRDRDGAPDRIFRRLRRQRGARSVGRPLVARPRRDDEPRSRIPPAARRAPAGPSLPAGRPGELASNTTPTTRPTACASEPSCATRRSASARCARGRGRATI